LVLIERFKMTKDKKQWILGGALLLCCVVINLYSQSNYRVENGYSAGFYRSFSNFFRLIFGWIPFSIGDFIYGGIVIYALVKMCQLTKFLFTQKKNNNIGSLLKKTLFSTFVKCCLLYIFFNIFWGINYNRLGIASQLNINVEKFSIEELKNINIILVEKINDSKIVLLKNKTTYPTNSELFLQTKNAYINLSKKYSFLNYKNESIKSSMWGWLGNYTGFLGYYNPFTGEAQINTTVPKFTQPFTACHEVAHQLGYAKEMEANFVGYLAAAASTDTLFRYSVYLDLFTYSNRTLYFADSASALECRKKLLPEVVSDFKERRRFNDAHRSFIEPIISYLYGKFLEQNQQPMGILSYDEVTAFIIAHYKKFGNI
jgi:Protein of unknown function (DUF3810)